MSIQINNILIWQKNGELRNLELLPDAVNVITGDPGKGKSSILRIIDYCLLSSSPKGISKENIDSKSNWYGLRVFSSKGPMTIARPSFESMNSSSVYFSESGEIPDVPEINMKVDGLKKVLDKEFGIDSGLVVPFGGKTIKAGSKVGFRSFLNYCYQDQNTIIEPNFLFMGSHDKKVIERIERTFRMAIGIVDLAGAVASSKLDDLNQKLISLERRSKIMTGKQLEFQDELAELEGEAITLGLVDSPSHDSKASLEVLKSIAVNPIVKFDSINEQIVGLEARRLEIKRKLRGFNKFKEDYSEYQKSLKDCEDSLKPVSYLLERYEEIISGSQTSRLLNILEEELLKVKESWKTRKTSVLFVDVGDNIKTLNAEYDAVTSDLERLNRMTRNLSSPADIYRYQGKLEAKVKFYSSEKVIPKDYSEEIKKIKGEILELDSLINDQESKKEFVLRRLDALINEHLTRLKLKGYESSTAVFLERDRVVNLVLDSELKVERMSDIGSASNYLYIHLAFFMAMHEVARENHVSWMPRFLVFDQLSSPYGSDSRDDKSSLDEALKELNSYVERMKKKGGMQVILMEHIPETRWKNLGLKNFNLIDRELRGNYGLINQL